MTSLIIYCYLENENTKKNLNFFLKNGVFNDEKYFYIFLINNKICTCKFPDYSNINKIYTPENSNDLYTYNWYLKSLDNSFFDNYSYFYFINSSCIGPFIPPICKNNWINMMNDYLNDYEMIGPIIEIPPDSNGFKFLNYSNIKNIPFIHTYMFGFNKTGFKIFKDILNKYNSTSKLNAVIITERIITSAILLNNGKIKSLLSKFKNINLNDPNEWVSSKHNEINKLTCYEIPNNYFGIDVNPFEIIFVKNIRNTNETRHHTNSGISQNLAKQIDNYCKWL